MSDLSISIEHADGRSIDACATTWDDLDDDAQGLLDLCLAGDHCRELRAVGRMALLMSLGHALGVVESESWGELSGTREYRAEILDDYFLVLVKHA